MAMDAAPSNLEQNNAPLLDILFNLLIFFILACEFSERESVKLTAPTVVTPQSVTISAKDQLVFNLVPDEKKPEVVKGWSIKGVNYLPGDPKLKELLVQTFTKAFRAGKQPGVILRADQATPYQQIYEAMGTLSEAYVDAAIKANLKAEQIDPRINMTIAGR